MKRRKVGKVRTCPCGHEEGWHTGPTKACQYGHDHAMGGCNCLGFRSRRYSTGESLLNPVAKLIPDPSTFLEAQLATAFQQLDASLAEAMSTFRRRAYEIFKKDLHKRDEYTPVLSPRLETRPARQQSPLNKTPHLSTNLSKCATKILGVLAQFDPKPLDTKQICIIAGYRASGGTSTAFADLRKRGLAEGSHDSLTITNAGRAACTNVVPLPRGRELLEMWVRKLKACPGRILTFMYDNNRRYTAEEICDALNYQMSGGTSTAFATLRALDLIEGSGKSMRLKREVFER